MAREIKEKKLLRANFIFQNAAEIELEWEKKRKFILITTLKAYITGTIFARSRIYRETRKVCGSITSTLRYRFRGVHTIGDFYRKIHRRITVAPTGSSSMMRKSSRNRGHIYDTSSGHKLPFYNTISQFFLDGSWHREEFYQISLADLRTSFL